MTLISAFQIADCPVVVGDLLLSGPERAGGFTGIPTVGDIRHVFPEGSGWSIVGLRQKVTLISPNCVVAWAGSRVAASMIVQELRARSSNTALCYDILADHFSHLSPEVLQHGVSFVGWIRDTNGFRRFGFDARTSSLPLFNEIHVAGSGTESFLAVAQAMPHDLPPADRELNPLEMAVCGALTGTGLMLQSELHTHRSLLEFFGGGYEIASFVGGQFEKIGDVTFVFWVAEHVASGIRLSWPHLALKQDYLGDLLTIRAARFAPGETPSAPLEASESLHVVSPIYRHVTKGEAERLAAPAMNSRFTCHLVLVHSDGPPRVLARLEYRHERVPTSIAFSGEPGRLQAFVDEDFIRRLLASIHHELSHNPPFPISPPN